MQNSDLSSNNLIQAGLLVLIGSFLLAGWAFWIDPIINRDGVKYVLAAEAFAMGEYLRALDAYKWPFYSMSIALFSKITPFSVETSAYVLNALFRGLGGIAFLKICLLLGANRNQIWLAAAVYLLFPGLNEVQSMIIRDFGYLCCFLWMVYFFMQQLANPTRGHVLGFVVMGLIATAFRIEGVIYVFGLLIFYLLSSTVKGHLKVIGYGIILLVVPVLCYFQLMWLYNGDISNSLASFTATVNSASEDLQEYIEGLESAWLQGILNSVSYFILLVSPFARMFWSTLAVLSTGYILLLIYGWFTRPVLELENPRIALMAKGWRWMVGMNIMVLVTFVMIKQIVTDRYPLSLALILMLLIPFIWTDLWHRISTSARAWVKPVMGFVIVALFIINGAEGLDRFTVKHHLKEAGLHVKANLRPGEVFLTNNRVIDYYAGTKEIYPDTHYGWPHISEFVDTLRWTELGWIALYFNRHQDPALFEYLDEAFYHSPPIVYMGPKGSRVIMHNPAGLRRGEDPIQTGESESN